MTSEGFTFIHAAGVLVDHQARDIAVPADESRAAVLDASCVAWQRLIEACVDLSVDFLLLGGETFAEADRSLRARVALREGLDLLADAGVQVFVVPGTCDPTSAWQKISGLPDVVTLFDPEVDEPTAVIRHGEVLASVQACLDASPKASTHDGHHETIGHSRIAPFRIGIAPTFSTDGLPPSQQQVEGWLARCPVDYLALPRPFRRIEVAQPDRMAHCPGPAVALTGTDLGPLGASLVKVESNNAVSVALLPVSPLRRERLHIRVDGTSTIDLLIQCMRQLIQDLKSIEHATVLQVDWRIKGDGALYDSLHANESQAELFELFGMDGTTATDLFIDHQLTLLTEEAATESIEPAVDESETDDVNPMLLGFQQRLDQEHSIVQSVMNRHWSGDEEPATPWLERLESLRGRVDHASVAGTAHDLAQQWFGDLEE